MKKLLKVSSILAVVAGVIMVVGGIWGICFTRQNVSQEKIVTPGDARIPNASLRGPRTIKAQADIIREHTLNVTGGKTYAEMPREIQKLDASGKGIVDSKGAPVMVPNDARNIWITATTLTTALHLAIFSYVFSVLVLICGFISIWTGIVFGKLTKKF